MKNPASAFAVILASLALIVGAYVLIRTPDVQPASQDQTAYGNASSPGVINGCQTINGVETCSYHQTMRFASTTCSFAAPTDATSTLVFGGAKIDSSRGGAFDLEFGKDSTQYATTTSLGHATPGITSGGRGTFVATTTAAVIQDGINTFKPGTYFNVKIGTTTVSTGLQGQCDAVFKVI